MEAVGLLFGRKASTRRQTQPQPTEPQKPDPQQESGIVSLDYKYPTKIKPYILTSGQTYDTDDSPQISPDVVKHEADLALRSTGSQEDQIPSLTTADESYDDTHDNILEHQDDDDGIDDEEHYRDDDSIPESLQSRNSVVNNYQDNYSELPPELAAITVSGPIRVGKSNVVGKDSPGNSVLDVNDKHGTPPKVPSEPATLIGQNNGNNIETVLVMSSTPNQAITCICSTEGRIFAGTRDGLIIEWDLASGSVARTLRGHTKSVTSMAAGSGWLFSGGEDGSLRTWIIATGVCVKSFNAHDGFLTALCMTAEGRLFSGGQDRMIYEWEPKSGKRLWGLSGHTKWIVVIKSSSDRLFSGGTDNTIRVWDMANGRRCLHVLRDHAAWVYSLAIAPYSDVLYSAAKDGLVKAWDIDSGECLGTISGHSGSAVRGIAVSNRGDRLYTGSEDKTIVEWDTKNGEKLRSMVGHTGSISSIIYSSNGMLYSASGDGTVRVWDIAPPVANSTLSRSTSYSNRSMANDVMHSRLPPRPSSIDDETADVESLRNSLTKIRELLNQTNYAKLKLKEELATTRAQLAAARSELTEAQAGLARLEMLEQEREALLRDREDMERAYEENINEIEHIRDEYEIEIDLLTIANESLSNFAQKYSDQQYFSIEVDLAGIRSLLEHPHTPLHQKKSSTNLEDFFQPQSWKRTWDVDSDWDSDVEMDDEDAWWRDENPYDVKAKASLNKKLDMVMENGRSPSRIERRLSSRQSTRAKFELPPGEPNSGPFRSSYQLPSSTAVTAARLLSNSPIPSNYQQSRPDSRSSTRPSSPNSFGPKRQPSQQNIGFGSGGWFKPFRNLVESTIEQFAPPIPPQAKYNMERERENREKREQRDRELRDIAQQEALVIEAHLREGKSLVAPRIRAGGRSNVANNTSNASNNQNAMNAEMQRRERQQRDLELREQIAKEAELAELEASTTRRTSNVKPNERGIREIRDRELREAAAQAAQELESATKKVASVSGNGSVIGSSLSKRNDEDSKSMISGYSATGGVGVRAMRPVSVGNGGGIMGALGMTSGGLKPVTVDNKVIKVKAMQAEPLPELDDDTLPPLPYRQTIPRVDTPMNEMNQYVSVLSAEPLGQSVNAYQAPAYLMSRMLDDDEDEETEKATTHNTRARSYSQSSVMSASIRNLNQTEDETPLEKMATVFENAIENAIENPWGLLPEWLRSTKVSNGESESHDGPHAHPQVVKKRESQNLDDSISAYRIAPPPSTSSTRGNKRSELKPNANDSEHLTTNSTESTSTSTSRHRRKQSITASISEAFASAFEVLPPPTPRIPEDVSSAFEVEGEDGEDVNGYELRNPLLF
ncbi:hypothetical protein HK098_003459 [Nowakowskiella sp. JEL0407]|nr:hypothetical protein HK098_003459 [Nowakowskiella sp. JEL0407]